MGLIFNFDRIKRGNFRILDPVTSLKLPISPFLWGLFVNVARFARKLFWALERYIYHILNLLGHTVGWIFFIQCNELSLFSIFTIHASPKPSAPSVIAKSRAFSKSWKVEWSGRQIMLKQVWAVGKLLYEWLDAVRKDQF